MRIWMRLGLAATVTTAAPLMAQQSGIASVVLVARKAGLVGLSPIGVDPQIAGLVSVTDRSSQDTAGLLAVWNVPPEQIGDLRLRTTRGAAAAGASYIERRVILLDPVAHARHDLDLQPVRLGASDALVVVRLVVY